MTLFRYESTYYASGVSDISFYDTYDPFEYMTALAERNGELTDMVEEEATAEAKTSDSVFESESNNNIYERPEDIPRTPSRQQVRKVGRFMSYD